MSWEKVVKDSNVLPQIHRLILAGKAGLGFPRIPDHQRGVRCKLSLRNPAIGGAEERRLRRMEQYAARRSERLPASGRQATPQMVA
jgi:hypothetical protein